MLRSDLVSEKIFDLGNIFKFHYVRSTKLGRPCRTPDLVWQSGHNNIKVWPENAEIRSGFRKIFSTLGAYLNSTMWGRSLSSATSVFVQKKNFSDKNINSLNFWARRNFLVPKSPAWRPEFRTGFRKIFWGREHGQNRPGVRRLRRFLICSRNPTKRRYKGRMPIFELETSPWCQKLRLDLVISKLPSERNSEVGNVLKIDRECLATFVLRNYKRFWVCSLRNLMLLRSLKGCLRLY